MFESKIYFYLILLHSSVLLLLFLKLNFHFLSVVAWIFYLVLLEKPMPRLFLAIWLEWIRVRRIDSFLSLNRIRDSKVA